MAPEANSNAAAAAQLMTGQKLCDSCGAQILAKAEICPKCGVRQRAAVSKVALLLFTFFTGGIGGHKFYLGKYWQGILYLLFFWTGIPGLVALVEFFIYAFTSSERLNEKYSAASAGVVVAIVVVALVGVMFVGILAAVAIPAYQDYVQRARVTEAIMSAAPWRQAIEVQYFDTQKLPAAVGDLRQDLVPSQGEGRHSSVSLGPNAVLTVTMSPQGGGSLAGKTIILRPEVTGGAIRWHCGGGTVEPRYRPPSCRAP
jgi:TM2 domain-containing membrane protein YozV/Tfp pilus assembly protein PilE